MVDMNNSLNPISVSSFQFSPNDTSNIGRDPFDAQELMRQAEAEFSKLGGTQSLGAPSNVGVPGVHGFSEGQGLIEQALRSILNPRPPEMPQSTPPSLSAGSFDSHIAKPSKTQFFNVEAVRKDFPILKERVNGHQLVWLDNAATTQKPNQVIDRISDFYRHESSNIHRAAHTLAARSTEAYESARKKVARFLNAPSENEIIFVRGATEAINLAANTWGEQNISAGDEIVVTWLEHHSNIVPWQLLAARKGAKIVPVPINERGEVRMEEFARLISPKVKLVAITHVSNALGTINPVAEMTAIAHRLGAKVLIDGAQAVSHIKVDVQTLGADFYAFSGHKVFGPTGIGVLYGKRDVLATLPPWQGGGNMIEDVTFHSTKFQPPPARFEAGTGNIADAVGLGAALDYVMELGLENIARYEHELLEYSLMSMADVPGLNFVGGARERTSVLSFTLQGYSPQEVGTALDREGIAVRSGHHCAQPTLRHFGLEACVRPSLAFYNMKEEIDKLVHVLRRLKAN
jgi:cysteine desulfurase/selenocysteine lyase